MRVEWPRAASAGTAGYFPSCEGRKSQAEGKTKTQLRHDVTGTYPSHVSGALQTDAASEVELSSTPTEARAFGDSELTVANRGTKT